MTHLAEPLPTAFLLTVFGVLLGVSILLSRASERIGVPVALFFLVVGMLAGSEGIGGIPFNDYRLAFRLGVAALVLILFDGGLNTSLAAVRQFLAPAAVLATAGVIGVAALVAAGAHLLGLPGPEALLLGAIVSSTDAASVFAVLRGSGLQLQRRVGVTLEVESGINDPMAVILTIALTASLIEPGTGLGWWLVPDIVREMVVGGALGLVIGYGGRLLLPRVQLPAGGLYPALTLAIALLAFGVTTLLHGSGFVAVYAAAVIVGNGAIPFRASVLRVHDALAWLSQIAMFLVLGLLVTPSRLAGVVVVGVALALILPFIARPIVVALCLLPFRYPYRDIAYIGWVGLRGAVPIILATFPVLAGAPGASKIFNIVFIIVVVSAIVPGSTVPWITRWLGLESREPPAPKAVLEIESRQPLRGELMSFYIDPALAVTGVALSDVPFPAGSTVMLLVRGQELIAPRGSTTLEAGDHVYLFARPEDRAMIHLMFGRPESG
ncbi:MAG TPA: potassium/proton antiporter [Gemmatimonadaceae bacterium]|nr:potassium/proton antiporter [Gemmatimonadaceae bacterium]